jgi:hypothetical protein
MIFEVESAATNAMANNPAKIFGQPSDQFERPLFFFHIIVRSGDATSRIENLKGVFGSHNYRVYRLDSGMATQLVKDILTQHRRIRRKVDIGALMSLLIASPYLSTDRGAILDHAAEVGLCGAYLSDLAELAGGHPDAKALFLRHLRERLMKRKWGNIDTGYRKWLGYSWSPPIHLGLLFAEYPKDRARIFEQLRWWQDRSSFMSQIGPHFGLSRDYDLFIFGAAGAVWALVAALMIEDSEAVKYIAEQMLLIVRGLARAQPVAWLHSAVWGLHIAASGRNQAQFEELRHFANDRGGAPLEILYNPPASVAIEDDDGWHEATSQPAEPIPEFHEFVKRRAEAVQSGEHPNAVDVALAALVAGEALFFDGRTLVHLLSQSDSADVA